MMDGWVLTALCLTVAFTCTRSKAERVRCNAVLRLSKKVFCRGTLSPRALFSPGLLSREAARLPRSPSLQLGGLFLLLGKQCAVLLAPTFPLPHHNRGSSQCGWGAASA